MRIVSQMPTTITIDTPHSPELGSPHSSSRSASRSNSVTDDGSDSYDSLLDEGWDQVYHDDIDPSDSASRPRTSTYRSRERAAPARRPVRRHTTTERSRSAHRISRHSGVGRPPSTVDSDHYPAYGRPYPEPSPGPYGGRMGPGYAPSAAAFSAVAAPGPYAPPYGAPGALTHYGPPGPYSQYAQGGNPFSPQAGPGPTGASFFNGHHQMPGHGNPGAYGHEVMQYPPMGGGYGYPGYPPPHMQYFPYPHPGSDHSVNGEESDKMEKQLLAMEERFKKQELAQEEERKKLTASHEKAQKELADWQAKEEAKRKEAEAKEEERRRADEIKAAWERKLQEEKEAAAKAGAESAKKQIEDEKKAAEAKAAEEKKIADLKAAAEKAEADAKALVAKIEKETKEANEKTEKEAKEKIEAAAKENQEQLTKALAPKDDKKKPIRFKDAMGRKFSFPFHLCATWAGMEELIKQAFLHVDVISNQVMAGHYDLIGPNGEIILPQVWETMIEPDWAITMHMWPVPEKPPGPPVVPPHLMGGRPGRHRGDGHQRPPPGPPPPPGHRGGPPPANWRPPGPGAAPGPGAGPGPAQIVTVAPPGPRSSSGRRKTEPKGALLGWMIGNSKPKSSGKGLKKAEQPICLVM